MLGLGQTGSAAPGERTLVLPGPEYRTLHAAYDVKKANEMLDKLGLTKKDGEGYRLRADGAGRLRLALTTYLGFLPFTRIGEMIDEQWKKIGIRGEIQEMERGLATAKVQTNEHQIYFETQWGADNIYGHTPLIFPADGGSPLGPLYGIWYSSAGVQGKKPPPRMRELMDKYRKSFGVTDAGADQAGQGRVEDRAGRAVDDPRRVELARLAGRARDQDEHGQRPRAALEQRGQRQPPRRPHGDLVLQVVARAMM